MKKKAIKKKSYLTKDEARYPGVRQIGDKENFFMIMEKLVKTYAMCNRMTELDTLQWVNEYTMNALLGRENVSIMTNAMREMIKKHNLDVVKPFEKPRRKCRTSK